ncbi:MAG: hypothetical protein ABR606_08420 [Vicinamibacterales bacterium]
MNHIRAADSRPEWAEKLPLFVAEIRRIFTADELQTYFATATRVGPAWHVASDEQYGTMRGAGMFDDDIISAVSDAILFERARALLIGDTMADAAQ